MKVRIVCRDDQLDWILGKIATRLFSELEAFADASIGPRPDVSADINHYVWYDDYDGSAPHATIGVTHIDSVRKFDLLQGQLRAALAGICLSRMHMEELVHAGLARERLCYVNPAHDALSPPNAAHVGITTRLYPPDPCKREWLLLELAERIQPADFRFSIMGSDWDPIVERLRQKGFDVAYYPEFDRQRYSAILPTFDYYLYLGWDEGSMGILDALHAGVPTIATPQGFHLDIPGGLTYPVDDIESLVTAFNRIAGEKASRTAAVSTWTWQNYAAKHLQIWDYLLTGVLNPAASRFVDGVSSLVRPLDRDAERGRTFVEALERIDTLRARLRREYDATHQ